jgi:hypothetical protein
VRRALGLAALAACGLVGCGPDAPPLPKVLSIEPNTMTSSSIADVIITVDAVLPFTVDYQTGQVTVIPSVLTQVDQVSVGNGRYAPGGRLPARIPSKLQPGAHDVTVLLVGDGRVGTLPNGFTVTPGVWPAGGFTVAPIFSPQRVDAAFMLTITAQGAGASSFNGTVDYVIQNVSSKPVTTGPFTNGVYQESVVLHSPTTGTTHITVVDLLGRLATSNEFVVTP